jgi:FlaA1/EpsC-like NDP-sugar epimerase
MNIKDKTILITGANRSIGRACLRKPRTERAEQSSQGNPTSIGLRNSHDESVRPA